MSSGNDCGAITTTSLLFFLQGLYLPSLMNFLHWAGSTGVILEMYVSFCHVHILRYLKEKAKSCQTPLHVKRVHRRSPLLCLSKCRLTRNDPHPVKIIICQSDDHDVELNSSYEYIPACCLFRLSLKCYNCLSDKYCSMVK